MLFIFPLVYIASFFVAFKETLKGNRQGILVFLIFGLSVYTTAMSVAFTLGLKNFIPYFQSFKEVLILTLLILNVVTLKHRPKWHLIDYALFAFLGYTFLYAVLPIGEQNFVTRLMAFKSTSFFVTVYFTGRLTDVRTIYISKYLNYILLVTIAAATVLCVEVVFYTHLQTITGFSEYNYYFFNFESSGSYGLTTTFESDGGYKRFASFFSTPIEHGTAAMLALCIIAALYTTDKNKISINTIGLLATGASLMSVFFAFSRAPLAGYFIVIYVYSLITKRKFITNSIHAIGVVALLYLTYLFTGLGDSKHGIIEIIMNTIDFSDPSSVGHLVQWVEGIVSMIEKPFGLGLGSSGRVAGTLGENVGGENQFIVIGVQAGIVALLLYLSVYIMLIRTSLRWLPELKGRERKICMIVLLFKIGLLLPLLTTEIEASVYISYITWFLSGLFISIIMKSNQLALQPSYD